MTVEEQLLAVIEKYDIVEVAWLLDEGERH